MLGQIPQHCQRAGTQGKNVLPPPQAAVRHIKTERPKSNAVLALHGVILSRGLNSI
jgi:hypothetical protein